MKELLLAAALTATITPAFAAENYRTWTGPELLQRWSYLNGECRGGSGDDAVRRAQPRRCRAFRPRLLLGRDGINVALGKRPRLALDTKGRGSCLPLRQLKGAPPRTAVKAHPAPQTRRALGMKMTLLGVAAFAAQVAPAWATMPLLGEKPPMRTDEACWAWADQQAKDEEIAFMWGILDDGNTDHAVAVRRC
jgi:hypothetical protein